MSVTIPPAVAPRVKLYACVTFLYLNSRWPSTRAVSVAEARLTPTVGPLAFGLVETDSTARGCPADASTVLARSKAVTRKAGCASEGGGIGT